MSHLIPLEDYVIVEIAQPEKTTKSGIILPPKEDKPGYGTVIAVGPGKILDDGKRWAMDVCVGDTVYFTKYAPDEVEVEMDGEKKKVLIVKQSSILAKLPKWAKAHNHHGKKEGECCGGNCHS